MEPPRLRLSARPGPARPAATAPSFDQRDLSCANAKGFFRLAGKFFYCRKTGEFDLRQLLEFVFR
jgi:hypothetical protein